jgi:hypothetical protein
MSSSAAPIYFPSHGKHMDGAVMVNNPALSALGMVMSEKVPFAPSPLVTVVTPLSLTSQLGRLSCREQVVDRQDPARIHMLSLGTGRMVQYVEGDNLDWGMIQVGHYPVVVCVCVCVVCVALFSHAFENVTLCSGRPSCQS